MMKVYLFRHPETISEKQFRQELLPQLPAWRQKEALKYKHLSGSVLNAIAFILLKDGLRNDFGIDAVSAFGYEKNGKPYLTDAPQTHFNLSHCKRGVLCVISDKAPVGCDIEVIGRKVSTTLIERCCNRQELEEIRQSDQPDTAFIRLWTIKEAVLKLSGGSVIGDMRHLLDPDLHQKLSIETQVCLQDGIAYTVCESR